MRIHHIGYLIKDMDKALAKFEFLGYTLIKGIIQDLSIGLSICFIEKDGYTLELVSPIGKNSIVSNLIKRYGNSPYHICYETDRFDEDIRELSQKGFVVIAEPESTFVIPNTKTIFLLNHQMGLIELIEGQT